MITFNNTEIRDARLKLGLTQSQLELKLGFINSGGRNVRSLESGENVASHRKISGAASILLGMLLSGKLK